jgi:serine/threonine-protein kinase RsbT
MTAIKSDVVVLRSETDVVSARQAVRRWSQELGFSLVDTTKMVTAASELARNAFFHGGGGEMRLELRQRGERRGLTLTFEDHGPGIPNIDQALADGFTTGKGMGMGLGGARRLVNEFEISSQPGCTRVVITRWRS